MTWRTDGQILLFASGDQQIPKSLSLRGTNVIQEQSDLDENIQVKMDIW
jgi:hypothetical protein